MKKITRTTVISDYGTHVEIKAIRQEREARNIRRILVALLIVLGGAILGAALAVIHNS